MKTIKVKDYSQIPKDFTGMAEIADGSKCWYLNGKPHGENDLPAIEFPDGTKYWCLNGLLHRENDLPAIECSTGSKYWYLNGLFHRENGPAIEWANGEKSCYYCGKQYNSFKELQKIHRKRIMNPNIVL